MAKTVRVELAIPISDEHLQQVRIGHCSHEDKDKVDHKCVGSMIVSPHGVALHCTLCGNEDPLRCIMGQGKCDHGAD